MSGIYLHFSSFVSPAVVFFPSNLNQDESQADDTYHTGLKHITLLSNIFKLTLQIDFNLFNPQSVFELGWLANIVFQ